MKALAFKNKAEESTFDLNLAPMMDMFVTIIPFMLLSVTFMQIMLLDVSLPVPVAKALAEDRSNNKREVSIMVRMNMVREFMIEVKNESGQITKYSVSKKEADFDYALLHKKLVEVKQRYPRVFRIEMNPDGGVNYNHIVKAMDAARNVEKDDPKILIENAPTPLLFPDVIMANILG